MDSSDGSNIHIYIYKYIFTYTYIYIYIHVYILRDLAVGAADGGGGGDQAAARCRQRWLAACRQRRPCVGWAARRRPGCGQSVQLGDGGSAAGQRRRPRLASQQQPAVARWLAQAVLTVS